jgi:hypothetical protein
MGHPREQIVSRRATIRFRCDTGLIRHGAPTEAAQISTPRQCSRLNEYCGMSAAQRMRRCRLTIASLPLDSRAQIRGGTVDLNEGGLRYDRFCTELSTVIGKTMFAPLGRELD